VTFERARVWKWRNWPRCSYWDDVIGLPGREEEGEGHLGTGNLPTNGSLASVPCAESLLGLKGPWNP
jgi:hypothetical protein